MTEKQKPAEQATDTTITMSTSEFKALLLDSQQSMARMLADALVESKKPYSDPRQKENDEMFRQSSRETQERMRKQVMADQATCTHLQGSNPLSDFPSPHGLTSIVMHDLGDGTVFGVCTNCLRQFWPSDADYGTWMRKKSGNRISAAGRRWARMPQTRSDTAPQPTPEAEPVVV